MQQEPTRRRSARWIGIGLLALVIGGLGALHGGLFPGAAPARADGDPLEEYDFSGEVPTHDFVHQSRMRVWQHGLWTVQRHVELDPFEGSMWALTGCTFERINVYFGTRPLWHGKQSYRASFGTPTFGSHHEQAPRWKLVVNTIDPEWEGDPRDVLAVDYTDSGGLTLLLAYWNGGANSGNSAELIRLNGNRPETASVEVLWSGRYEDLEDLDGDGEPEIIDSDWAHHMASYLPHKGIWGSVILDWSAEEKRYVVANDRLYTDAMRRQRSSDEGKESWQSATWITQRRDEVREAVRRIAEAKESWEPDMRRDEALLTLASALLHYLWTGHVVEARALLMETDLWRDEADHASRKVWWSLFLEGCRRSNYWKDLCVTFPQLKTLDGEPPPVSRPDGR